MQLENFTGIILAVTVFITVAIGHEFVRKITYYYGTKPAPFVFIIGIGLFISSLYVNSYLLSAVIGVFAITVVWDGYEIYKQEERIRKGHAAENPNRPVIRINEDPITKNETIKV